MTLALSILLLASLIQVSQGFLLPLQRRRTAFSSPRPSSSSSTALCLSTTSPVKPSVRYNETDLYSFNQNLNELAEHAGDYHRGNVIADAAECEQTWRDSSQNTDIVSFNTVLKAWARCCQSLADHRSEIEVDYSSVVDVPVYTALDAAKRALEILEHQEQDDSAVKPDVTSYNIVMDAFVKSRNDQACDQVLHLMTKMQQNQMVPDFLSWNALVDAYAYSDRVDRIRKIEQILQQMEKKGVHPTARTMNSVLHAYSRNVPRDDKPPAEHAQRCIDILNNMKRQAKETGSIIDQPDALTYTTVIHALSRCGSLKTTMQAEALFQELLDLFETTRSSRLQPSVYTYTVMILTWARTPARESTERAEYYLQKLLDDDGVKPNAKAFTATMQAYARSRDPNRATHVLRLLKQMRELAKTEPGVAPNLVTYRTALDACGRTQGTFEQQMVALRIAFAIFKTLELETKVRPNHTTYSAVLKATGNLLPPGDERNSIARKVIEKAMAAGQVDTSVVFAFQKAADANLQHEILAPLEDLQGKVHYEKMPTSWSRHVEL